MAKDPETNIKRALNAAKKHLVVAAVEGRKLSDERFHELQQLVFATDCFLKATEQPMPQSHLHD